MRLLVAILIIFSLVIPTYASIKEVSFRATIDLLENAIRSGDGNALAKHVDLNGILRYKIRRYSAKAEQKSSAVTRLAGRLAGFSEPAITGAASRFIMSEFSKSSPGLRGGYLRSLDLTKIGKAGRSAYAVGTFLGKPAVLSAVKIGTQWIIIGVESPIIDSEFKNLLRIIHVPL